MVRRRQNRYSMQPSDETVINVLEERLKHYLADQPSTVVACCVAFLHDRLSQLIARRSADVTVTRVDASGTSETKSVVAALAAGWIFRTSGKTDEECAYSPSLSAGDASFALDGPEAELQAALEQAPPVAIERYRTEQEGQSYDPSIPSMPEELREMLRNSPPSRSTPKPD